MLLLFGIIFCCNLAVVVAQSEDGWGDDWGDDYDPCDCGCCIGQDDDVVIWGEGGGPGGDNDNDGDDGCWYCDDNSDDSNDDYGGSDGGDHGGGHISYPMGVEITLTTHAFLSNVDLNIDFITVQMTLMKIEPITGIVLSLPTPRLATIVTHYNMTHPTSTVTRQEIIAQLEAAVASNNPPSEKTQEFTEWLGESIIEEFDELYGSTTAEISFSDCDNRCWCTNACEIDKPCAGDDKADPLIHMKVAKQTHSGIKGGRYGSDARKQWLNGKLVDKAHRGIDLENDYGDPVYAMFDGYATISDDMSKPKPTNGYMVSVTSTINGKTVIISYLHQQKDGRVTGQVKQGDIIAYQGNSGNLKRGIIKKLTVSHVHIGIREDGVRVNPEKYFNRNITDTNTGEFEEDCN